VPRGDALTAGTAQATKVCGLDPTFLLTAGEEAQTVVNEFEELAGRMMRGPNDCAHSNCFTYHTCC
jgi:hypothetical protein